MSLLPVATTWYEDDSPRLSLARCFQLNNGDAPGEQERLVKTVNSQGKGGNGSPWTRPSAPGCGDTSKAPASETLDLRWRSFARTAPGSLSTGSLAGRTPTRETAHCTVRPTRGLVAEFRTASFKRSLQGSWVLKRCCGKRVDSSHRFAPMRQDTGQCEGGRS